MKLALITVFVSQAEAGENSYDDSACFTGDQRDCVTSRLETLKSHWKENLEKAPHLKAVKKARIEAKYNKFADKALKRYLLLKNDKGCSFPNHYKHQAEIDRYNQENPCQGFRQLTNQLIRWSTTFNDVTTNKCKTSENAWLERYHDRVNGFFSLIKDRVRKYCPKNI